MGRGMASLATRLIALLVLHPTAAQRPPSCDAGSGLAHYRKYKMSYDHEADGQELLYSALARLQPPDPLHPQYFIDVGANKGVEVLEVLQTYNRHLHAVIVGLHPNLCRHSWKMPGCPAVNASVHVQ